MKNLTIKLLLLLLGSVIIFLSCKKESVAPNPYGANNGQFTIFTKSDQGQGKLYVNVDGQPVGTITQYHTNGVACGSGNVNHIASEGQHSFNVTSDGGGVWNGILDYKKGECKSLELTGGSVGGGLAGNPGNPRFNLQFTNSQNVDLDLYVKTPSGNVISYTNPTANNGKLDVDCKCSSCPNGPNENIYWVNGTAPTGTYQVYVKYYNKCSSASTFQPSDFTLRILNQSTIIQTFTGTLSTQNQTSSTYSFNF
jgi:hypothetical protein